MPLHTVACISRRARRRRWGAAIRSLIEEPGQGRLRPEVRNTDRWSLPVGGEADDIGLRIETEGRCSTAVKAGWLLFSRTDAKGTAQTRIPSTRDLLK